MMSEKICSQCEGDEFEESYDHFDGFCTQCGLVIEDFDDPRSVTATQQTQPHVDSTQDQTMPDWSEYVTVNDATEQQYAQAIDMLESIADELQISKDSRAQVAEVYADAMLNRVTDGRGTPAVIGALLHIVSRNTGEIRPTRAISESIDVDERRISSFVRDLQYELSLDVAIPEPIGYLPHLYDSLDLDDETLHRSEQVIASLEESGLTNGKSPGGISGAVIYEVSDGSRTQREIADAVGVSTETIRQRLNDIRSHDKFQFIGGN